MFPTPPEAPRDSRFQGRGFAHTLRGRLVLTYVGLFILVLVALGAYLTLAARDMYIDRLADQLAAQGRIVGVSVSPLDSGAATIDARVKHLAEGGDARLTVIAADGTVLGDSVADPATMANHANRPEVIAALATGTGADLRHSTTLDRDFLYVAVPIPGDEPAVARVALPLDDINAAVGRIQRDILIATLLAALLVAAVSVYVSGRLAAPLDVLRRQAHAVENGHLDVTVEPSKTREIGELGRSFNAMTTRLRTMLTEIERSQARMEAMLAELDEGVVITDASGRILRLNRAAARMFGTTAEQAEGRPFVQVSRDHELSRLLEIALASTTMRATTIGTERGSLVLEASAQPVRGGGEYLGLLVLRDRTDLQRLEHVRREFVANVSHDLRTPLTSIKALVETLASGALDDPDVADDFLGRIDSEVDRLALLVDELLDLARLESGRIVLDMALYDPAAMLAGAVERLRPEAERNGVTLRLDPPPPLPAIRFDRPRLERVVLNLIHNAIKFTPSGGDIIVDAAMVDGKLKISVRDTGVGVAKDVLPRIFERFYKEDKTRSSGGTGLGLAIAKHIVQAHNGTIWAESDPGHGATFSFTVPAG